MTNEVEVGSIPDGTHFRLGGANCRVIRRESNPPAVLVADPDLGPILLSANWIVEPTKEGEALED